jgi:hypothetical protein
VAVEVDPWAGLPSPGGPSPVPGPLGDATAWDLYRVIVTSVAAGQAAARPLPEENGS